MNDLHLLKLEEVGKIYTDEDTATVGLHGVSLCFDRGEFVLLTGESGAGKSSLLNVIGGLDSFEEGEMYFCGEPLSKLGERGRDAFRDENISIIFQDYNIIESLSVRDNVLIALPEELSKKEKHDKANEMLRKTGMFSLARRKAGKLSGGQKQRVAIARALAMNRGIILADEPIAHLDNETADDIISALAEAAKDNLVIVSTHETKPFLQMSTRMIRLSAGTVAEDMLLNTSEASPNQTLHADNVEKKKAEKRNNKTKKSCNAGILLGSRMIAAKPRISALLFLLFFFCGLLLFLFSSAFARMAHRYTVINGTLFRGGNCRVVVTRRNGMPITEQEVERLAEQYHAIRSEHCDILIDAGNEANWFDYMEDPGKYAIYDRGEFTPPYQIVMDGNFGKPDIGRYPQKESECFLFVPYALSDYYGRTDLERKTIKLYGIDYQIVGVQYYLENDLQGRILLTPDGYQTCALMAYIGRFLSCRCSVFENGNITDNLQAVPVYYDYNADLNGLILRNGEVNGHDFTTDGTDIEIHFYFRNGEDKDGEKVYLNGVFNKNDLLADQEDVVYTENNAVIANPRFVFEMLECYMSDHYRQCTFLFANDAQAAEAVKCLNGEGYLVATGDDVYALDVDTLKASLLPMLVAFAGELSILAIIGFVVHVFISRIMQSMRYEVTVMRAVGVKSQTIKYSVYYRVLLPLVIALPLIVLIVVTLFRSSFFSKYLLWLRPGSYIPLFCGMMLIVCVAVERQRRKYLEISIKRALKGVA